MEHLLTIKDLTETEIKSLLDLADELKRHPNKYSSKLKGKCIILLFEKTSTRTRISFESGMYQLGGNVVYLDWKSTNINLGSLSDEIKCMGLYADLIMARVYDHRTLETIRAASSVPVINGLSDLYHPCQILSDLMTIREVFGHFDIKISYIGDGNNVCNSLIIGCIKLRIPISVATPKQYTPHKEVLNWVKNQKNSKDLILCDDPIQAVKDANVIYTDTFVSMGQEKEKEERLKIFLPKFQVNKELLTHAINDPYIMHCLPAHRGIEITDDVLDSNRSIVFQQAENRLHLQKALMLKLLQIV